MRATWAGALAYR